MGAKAWIVAALAVFIAGALVWLNIRKKK